MNDSMSGYYLDSEQQKIVLDDTKYLLVVAGAGSGKTLTILGKINYLVKYKNIDPNDILCISFTKAASLSLKDKIKKEFGYNMEVFTFHKLSLKILKERKTIYDIADSNTLENIIHEFFRETILDYNNYLKMVLYIFKIRKRKNIRESYLKFYSDHQKEFNLLERLLSTFIHLFKCNDYSLKDFSIFLKKARKTLSYFNYKKEKYLLIFSLNIYLLYQKYLEDNKEIDFDDMITKATQEVKHFGINKDYKYIIIDEYQDTSYVRFKLIKEILNKTNSKLMVVGDDFQSIYHFTGCELSLFLKFQEYFPNSKIMKITSTYRNSQELIKVAGDFVMKNKSQITKKLHSNKSLKDPIRIVYYSNIKQTFKEVILNIYQNTKQSILILGRNNKDIFMVLDNNFKLEENGKVIYLKNKDINLRYMTVHKSKGLEEDNVIIINLIDNLLGFPNKIEDDKLLRFVSRNYEYYPYSEERRLFYVALTRTRNYVYLLVPKKNKSIFVSELVKIITDNQKK